MNKVILLLFFFLFTHFLRGQEGCTDHQASNYNISAKQNDGSCIYPISNYALQSIATFPNQLNEISGLIQVDSMLLANVDQAPVNQIFSIDSLSGKIRRSIVVKNVANVDWEELAQSQQHVYIGDFGNNFGDRTNLVIHKIKKADLSMDTVSVESIFFAYEDQLDFSTKVVNQSNFDCEAFFYFNDSLHLFSKNWLNEETRHYVLPNTPGTHVAKLRGSYNVGGLITAADINQEGLVCLLGYTTGGSNFLWMFSAYQGTNFFSGNKRRIELGSGLSNGKTEGFAFRQMNSVNQGYITSENFEQGPFRLPPKLFAFDLSQFLTISTSIIEKDKQLNWQIAPNPFGESLRIKPLKGHRQADFFLFDSFGKLLLATFHESEITWSRMNLSPGFYFLQIKEKEQVYNFKLVKQ